MKESELNLSEILIPLLAKFPGAYVMTKGKIANFTINKKIFAFTKGNALVLKLPGSVIQDLLARKQATMLTMGTRTMKEWVTIRYGNYDECEKDVPLLKKAMRFVSEGCKAPKGT